MHELSITRSVVAIVAERAGGQRVTRVRLEIGRLAAVLPDAIRFCFDICAADTPLAGAELQIDEIPGRAACDACAREVALDALVFRCPRCGSGNLRVLSGRDLNIKEMETASCV
jgi:hydrogenase nickel incorporation protein HypA/HybF